MDMAYRIKERRLAMKLTQEALAAKLGLQKSAIAKYENGRVENIKRSVIAKMAEVLQCSPAYLMGWDDNLQIQTQHIIRRDESVLLKNYNMLNDFGKNKAQGYVEDLTENKKYITADEIYLNAAHERTDIEFTDEMRKHDDDIMNDPDF